MEEKLQQIIDLSRELVFDYGFEQHKIYKAITQHLKKLSTKTEYVLYNNCYGGFSFSDEFCEFAQLHKHGENRDGHHEQIVRFGKMLCDKYPKVSLMINYYYKYDMKRKVCEHIKYKQLSKRKQMMERNLENVLCLPKDMRIHTHNDVIKGLVYSSMFSINKFTEDSNSEYTAEDLVDELQNTIRDTTLEMEEMYPTLDASILFVLSNDFMKPTTEKDKNLSFLGAIKQYGESDSRIWNYQKHVCETAMKCILLNLENINEEPLDMSTIVYFGLMGASGKYACLQFEQVPAELSWTIEEYDGNETVRVA